MITEQTTTEHTRTHIKLCGMFRNEDIEAVFQVRPDLCGFIVDFPRSHRSVTHQQLIEFCQKLDDMENKANEELSKRVRRVGVFVDESLEKVAYLAKAAALDAIQLHGSEDDFYIAELRNRIIGTDLAVKSKRAPFIIQAFRIRQESDVQHAVMSTADLILLDNGQGSGSTFDWTLVKNVNRPFILAGGLNPNNVAAAVREVQPWGIDMSSGIETNHLKDRNKMRAAIAAVRQADKDRGCISPSNVSMNDANMNTKTIDRSTSSSKKGVAAPT